MLSLKVHFLGLQALRRVNSYLMKIGGQKPLELVLNQMAGPMKMLWRLILTGIVVIHLLLTV